MKSAIILALASAMAVVTLGGAGRAGSGGCDPSGGTYTFYRVTPPPAMAVGTGRFDGVGGCTLNPGPGSQKWTQDPNGQFYPKPRDGRSFCVHDGTPLTYEYKLNGDVISTGELQP